MTTSLRMPVTFGPSGSPRYCPVDHVRYDNSNSHKRLTAYAVFQTTEAAVRQLLPTQLELNGEPVISFEFIYMTEIQWLAGRGYNMLLVKIPARTVADFEGPALEGWFQPVIWENMCEPIISGREELGWSKIYAELPSPQQAGTQWSFNALWDGFSFMALNLDNLVATNARPIGLTPLMHRKYIPATGEPGKAEIDYLSVTPAGGPAAQITEHWTTDSAQLAISRARWEDMPTQFQIVNGLADVPLTSLVRAGLFRSQGGKNLSDQYRLY